MQSKEEQLIKEDGALLCRYIIEGTGQAQPVRTER